MRRGFGASSGGALSLVAAPNTGQLIIQNNVNFGFTDLAAVSQTFQPNHWYRLEVNWGKSGAFVGKLFDSNGTTLLKQVSASAPGFTAGGFGFRATGSDKFWDTVTDAPGVNGPLAKVFHPTAFFAGSSGSLSSGSSVSSPAAQTAAKSLSAPAAAIDAFFVHAPALAVNDFSILMPHGPQNGGGDPWWLLFA